MQFGYKECWYIIIKPPFLIKYGNSFRLAQSFRIFSETPSLYRKYQHLNRWGCRGLCRRQRWLKFGAFWNPLISTALNAPLKSTFLWFFRSPVSEIRQKAYYSLCNFVSVKVSSLMSWNFCLKFWAAWCAKQWNSALLFWSHDQFSCTQATFHFGSFFGSHAHK